MKMQRISLLFLLCSFLFATSVLAQETNMHNPIHQETAASELSKKAENLLGILEVEPISNGVVLKGIASESPIAVAGMKPGDIITRLNQTEIRSSETLEKALADFEVGDIIKLTFDRADRKNLIKITLGN